MKSLDEAIQHCMEVAEKQEKLAENSMNIQIKKYKVYDADEYIKCKECAEEHRQLAEWLKELKRFKALQCKSCNGYDCEENWCYRHGIDRSYDDFCSDWEEI